MMHLKASWLLLQWHDGVPLGLLVGYEKLGFNIMSHKVSSSLMVDTSWNWFSSVKINSSNKRYSSIKDHYREKWDTNLEKDLNLET